MNKFPCQLLLYWLRLGYSFSRIDNSKVSWYDLDLPESIKLRRQFFKETYRYNMIAKSVLDYSWLKEIPERSPTLIIIEGLFIYFKEGEVVELLKIYVKSFESGEMLIETIPPYLVKQYKNKTL